MIRAKATNKKRSGRSAMMSATLSPRLLALTLIGLALWTMPVGAKETAGDQPSAVQDIWWVGSGPSCHFDNLQNAIQAAGGGLEPVTHLQIRVAANSLSEQRLTVDLDNYLDTGAWHLEELRITGGYTECGGSLGSGNPRTTLNANGQCCENAHRVFNVLYHANENDPERVVVLENLVLTGGVVGELGGGLTFHGGGLQVVGQPGRVSVQLVNSIVHDNQAVFGSGGGIFVEATGEELVNDPANPLPMVALDNDSAVRGNSAAADGGGVACVNTHDPGLQIYSLSHVQVGDALVRDNSAQNGGGFSVSGCRAVLRAGGSYFWNVSTQEMIYSGGIMFNTAANRGGGVHVVEGGRATINGVASPVWGGDPESAAWIFSNTASRGGGIYAFGSETRVAMRDVWVEGNQVSNPGLGGAIYAGGLAIVFMDRWLWTDGTTYRACRLERPALMGRPARCSGLLNNQADDRGGAIFSFNGALVHVRNTFVVNNESDSLNGAVSHASNNAIFGGSPLAMVEYYNAQISGNIGPSRAIYSGAGGAHDLRYSTVAGNEMDSSAGSLIRSFSNDADRNSINIVIGSILWDENVRPLTTGGSNSIASVGCVISNDDLDGVNIPAPALAYYSEVEDPEFMDPAAGDYRLGLTSPAINYCDDSNSNFIPPLSHDLNLRDRDQVYAGEITEPSNPAPGRIYDLGAFVVFPDRLFSDRFEQE